MFPPMYGVEEERQGWSGSQFREQFQAKCHSLLLQGTLEDKLTLGVGGAPAFTPTSMPGGWTFICY